MNTMLRWCELRAFTLDLWGSAHSAAGAVSIGSYTTWMPVPRFESRDIFLYRFYAGVQ